MPRAFVAALRSWCTWFLTSPPQRSRMIRSQVLAKENFSLPSAGVRQCDQHADEQTDRSDPVCRVCLGSGGVIFSWPCGGAVGGIQGWSPDCLGYRGCSVHLGTWLPSILDVACVAASGLVSLLPPLLAALST